MKQVENLKKLEKLTYFDSQTISQITGLENQVLNNLISRWQKNGLIVKLKRELYTTDWYFKNNKNSESYIELISNKLRYPSYVSLEYVLSKHQILTESVFSITAVTNKLTRSFNNPLGRFSYKSIQADLFTGFEVIKKDNFDIALATKSKALFDYLYFKFLKIEVIQRRDIQDLRLNLEYITDKEKEEFNTFCKLTSIKKYIELPNLLFN